MSANGESTKMPHRVVNQRARRDSGELNNFELYFFCDARGGIRPFTENYEENKIIIFWDVVIYKISPIISKTTDNKL